VLVQPLWVGLLGAVGFTVVEYLSGDFAPIKLDDNLSSPVAAAAIMGVSLAMAI
jgi:dolichol kinase